MASIETSNSDCHGVAIPSVDETAIPCNGVFITTDCITSTKAFNFFGTGVGEYLTVILDKITIKSKSILNLVNINTAAIAAEVARATAAEHNLSLDISAEILRATTAENLKANIASPTFTGIPNAPTAAPGTNNTQIATTEYVDNAIAYVACGSYTLPTATGSVLGGIKVGTGLSIDGSGILSAPYSYSLPISSSTILGGIKIGSGLAIDGSGIVSVEEGKQKIISYPTDFLGTDYTLTNADNNYSILINNGGTAVTITVPFGLVSKFNVGLLQTGLGDVTITPSGSTIYNAISGYKIKGQYDQAYLEQGATSSIYYLLGNTKV